MGYNRQLIGTVDVEQGIVDYHDCALATLRHAGNKFFLTHHVYYLTAGEQRGYIPVQPGTGNILIVSYDKRIVSLLWHIAVRHICNQSG